MRSSSNKLYGVTKVITEVSRANEGKKIKIKRRYEYKNKNNYFYLLFKVIFYFKLYHLIVLLNILNDLN